MATTDYYALRDARALEMGLRHVSDGRCPRRLVGKHHRNLECWCADRLNDHAATYERLDDGRRLVAWEPYEADALELEPVFAAAAADGLTVTVTGSSPWNPGATVAIWFEGALTSGEAANRAAWKAWDALVVSVIGGPLPEVTP